jgi:nicotinic acid mononucleotide adenylyltransferase
MGYNNSVTNDTDTAPSKLQASSKQGKAVVVTRRRKKKRNVNQKDVNELFALALPATDITQSRIRRLANQGTSRSYRADITEDRRESRQSSTDD